MKFLSIVVLYTRHVHVTRVPALRLRHNLQHVGLISGEVVALHRVRPQAHRVRNQRVAQAIGAIVRPDGQRAHRKMRVLVVVVELTLDGVLGEYPHVLVGHEAQVIRRLEYNICLVSKETILSTRNFV
jgi:hypothetical protein